LSFNGQGGQELEHLVIGTRGFNNQTVIKALLRNFSGQLVVFGSNQTLDQAAPTNTQADIGVALANVFQAVTNNLCFLFNLLGELCVFPVVIQSCCCSDKSQVVTTEGTAMCTR